MPPYEVPDWLRVVILAVVQGIGEFLPISSSGHVVVGDALLGGAKESTRLNIVLHLGTLLSILVFYWQRIWQLLGSDRRVIGLLIVGTIPRSCRGPYRAISIPTAPGKPALGRLYVFDHRIFVDAPVADEGRRGRLSIHELSPGNIDRLGAGTGNPSRYQPQWCDDRRRGFAGIASRFGGNLLLPVSHSGDRRRRRVGVERLNGSHRGNGDLPWIVVGWRIHCVCGGLSLAQIAGAIA